MARPIVLGITGGIGSGKSVVRRLLSLLLSAPSYDSDSRAKALYHEPSVRAQVTGLLGRDPIDEEGQLRKELLREGLADPRLRPRLEQIVHRAVERDFDAFAAGAASRYVLLESAILFTSGLCRSVDVTIRVEAGAEQRARRAAERDRAEGKQTFAAMEALQERERRLALRDADYTIDNSGSASLIRQCEAILADLHYRQQ